MSVVCPAWLALPLIAPVFSIWFGMEAILLDKYLMVLVGGGIGSLARYILGTAISARVGGRFPLGTFVINVTGSFLIGLLMTLFTERLQLHPDWRLLLVVGF